MVLCGPPGHGALGASVSDWSTMEELHPAGDMHFCQKQETLGYFMREAPNNVRASLIIPGYQWKMVDCAEMVQFFIVLLLLGRIVQSFKERLSIHRDQKPASSSSALFVVKRNTLNKFHSGLDEDGHSEVVDDPDMYKPARRDITCIVVGHGPNDKPQCSDQEQPMYETARKIQALEQEQKATEIQVQEAKTFFKPLPATEKRLKLSLVIFMACVKSHILSLQEDCLKIKEMAISLGEKTIGKNLELGELGNGDDVDDHIKGSRRKLKYALTPNAHLNIQAREERQFCNNIAKEEKGKLHMTGRHKGAQTAEASIERAYPYLEEKENEITKPHHQNEIEHVGLLPVKEDLDLQHKMGSSEASGPMNLEAEQLETYRNQFQDLELHLERTISSYQCQILTLQSKALDNWLRAQEAKQNLLIARQEVADMRQRIRERAIQLRLLEADAQVFNDLSGAFGRENCFPDLCAQNGGNSEM